jgi:hypothetical protein
MTDLVHPLTVILGVRSGHHLASSWFTEDLRSERDDVASQRT